MQILVKFYTSYKAITGGDQVKMEVPDGSNVSQLIKTLAKKYENTPIDREESIVVVNEKIAMRDQVLNDGDTAMLFHQFAGG
jgi:molybdopterin converting factor small subunit